MSSATPGSPTPAPGSGPALNSATPGSLTVVPLPGVPEVRHGDNLAALLVAAVRAAGLELVDGDVLAITSKVVAKAEGRVTILPDDPAGRAAARVAAVTAETVRVVARRGDLVIAENRHGVVAANAMVDTSNTGPVDALVLPPSDPDAAAAELRTALGRVTGRHVAVIVTDTLGRAWRRGQTDAAVGVAGMAALVDLRGTHDADGRVLTATETAVADAVAAAADLVKGKHHRIPAALVRGLHGAAGDGRARDLIRPAGEDLFRYAVGPAGLLAFMEGRRTRRAFTDDRVDSGVVGRAVRTAVTAPFPHHTRPLRCVAVDSPTGRTRYLDAMERAWRADLHSDATPEDVVKRRVARSRALLGSAPVLLVPCLTREGRHTYPDVRRQHAEEALFLLAGGGAVQSLLLALHAQGLGAAWISSSVFCQRLAAAALGLPDGWQPLGSVVAGHPDPNQPPRSRPAVDLDDVLLRR